MIRDEMLHGKIDHEVHADAGRRPWISPSVQKLRAGSAEDGGGATPDAGINPS